MKFNFPVNDFTAGVWGEKFHQRSDIPQYYKALERMHNFWPHKAGGAQFRGGTARINSANQTNVNLCSRIVPYICGSDPTKSTLIGLQDSGNAYLLPSGTQVAPTFSTYVTGAWTSMGTYTPANYPGFSYTQYGDYLVFCDGVGTKHPMVFYWNAASGVYECTDLNSLAIGLSGGEWYAAPWGDVYALSNMASMTPSGTAVGAITITGAALAGSWSWPTSGNIVGAYVRFCSGTSADGVAVITSRVSNTVVNAYVLKTLPAIAAYGSSAAPTTFWQMDAYHPVNSFHGESVGFPKKVTSFEGRLIFANTARKPSTFYGSRIGKHTMFEEIPAPDTTGPFGYANNAYATDNTRPFSLTAVSANGGQIKAVSTGKTLVAHFENLDVVAYGSDGALGPNNVQFDSATNYGSNGVQPIRINGFQTFIDKSGRRVRDIVFNDTEAKYTSTDLTTFAGPLFIEGGTATGYSEIIQAATLSEDTDRILFQLSNGRLVVLSLDRDAKMAAWSTMTLGTSAATTTTWNSSSPVVSMCNSPDGKSVYMLVTRGADKLIEQLLPPWEDGNYYVGGYSTSRQPTFLDCSTAPTKSSALVWHCNTGVGNYYGGLTVSVIADGFYIGEYVVTNDANGTLTLTVEYTNVLVGFKYDGYLLTTGLTKGARELESVQGRIIRLDETVINLVRSWGGQYAITDQNASSYDLFTHRDHGAVISSSPGEYSTRPFVIQFNGVYGDGNYTRAPKVCIQQHQPFPFFISSIACRGVAYE